MKRANAGIIDDDGRAYVQWGERRMYQPTPEQCNAKEVLWTEDDSHTVAFACWHPQWGGYVGCCIVVTTDVSKGDNRSDKEWGPCFEVYNWHDGEFVKDNFVTETHYCVADQLIEFAKTVKKMSGV